MIAPRHMLVAPLLLAMGLCTPNKGYANDRDDDPLGIGRSSPNVVRAVELVLEGNAPTAVDGQRGWDGRHDNVAGWWTSLGRRGLPALLGALDPASPLYARERRSRALHGLTYMVRRWDLPLLRRLHEAGWRDMLWLQVLLQDRQLPRHARLALTRGSRQGIVELAALTYPHRLVDEAVLCIVAEGPTEIGRADSWIPTYIDSRQLTSALPALERWIAELEARRDADFDDPDDVLVPGLSRGLASGLEAVSWEHGELVVPPDRFWRVRSLWGEPRRKHAEGDWSVYVSDRILELQLVCARLGSRKALGALVEMTQPTYERAHDDTLWDRAGVASDAHLALQHLLPPRPPGPDEDAPALLAWWEQHRKRLHFDPETRTWSAE